VAYFGFVREAIPMFKKRKSKKAAPSIESAPPEAPKRRFPRIPAETSVLLRKLGGSLKGELSTTRVVGAGGCCFVHPEPQGQDSTLFLSILVGLELAEAKVRVAYERQLPDGQYEIGVEFLEIAPRDLALLDKLEAQASAKSPH
jgi:hypothetical protein